MRRAIALALFVIACHSTEPTPPPPPVTKSPQILAVPPLPGPIVADGELTEASWPGAVHSPAFEDADGRRAPFADLSAMADDDALYLSVYVADEDLRTRGDRVTLEIGALRLVLTPGAYAVPAGVLVGTDLDGVVDDAAEDDEEWVSEIVIPRRLLPPEPLEIRAIRVDSGHAGAARTTSWPRDGTATLRLPARSSPPTPFSR